MAYAVIFLVAFFGSTLIVFLVNHFPELKTTFNMLIMSMTASDFLIADTAIPLSLAYLYQGVMWFPGRFGVFVCKFPPFLAYLSIGASILTLVLMAFDRYLVIVHTMKRRGTSKFTVVAIGSTWFISGAVFGTELYKYRLFNESGFTICAPRWVEDLQKSHKITMYEMVFRFVIFYLIPLLVMAVL